MSKVEIMEQFKVGIIGTGGMGKVHAQVYGMEKNAKLTAVCDINPDAMEQFRDDSSIRCFTDAETFFAEADVDVVSIVTPHYDHPSLAVAALEHGKHVLVEKPIAVHKRQAEPLLEAIKRHPELVCSAMFCQRTLPAHQKIKRLLMSGELGRIQRFSWTITDWFRTQFYYDSGDWRASWRGEGGGVLLNQCPHQLDLLQWFFGMPSRVSATMSFGRYHDIEVEDDVTAVLEYSDGMKGVFIASTGESPGTNRLEIACDRGRLVYENGAINFDRTETTVSEFCATSRERFGNPERWKVSIPVNNNGASMHKNIIDNFLDVIAGRAELIAPAAEGIRELELGNAMLLSAWTDEKVALPIDGGRFEALLDEHIAMSRYRKKAEVKCIDENFSDSFEKLN